MARVQTLDQPSVQRAGLPGVQIEAAPVGIASEIAARQGAQLDQAGQQIADASHRIGIDMLEQANQLRVDDAVNQAKEQALNLTYGKGAGYTNLRGQDALQRPNGQSLGDEYGGNLQSGFSGIASTLGNDRQRQMFQQRAQPILQQFQAGLMQHENNEFKTYATSVREGTIQNRVNEIGLNYNNPAVVDDAIKSIQASTYDLARLNGRSAEWSEAQARKMTSNAHLTALTAALQNNDPIYADQYLKKYSGQMDANDILRANGLITKEADAKIGQAAAVQVMTGNQPSFAPTDIDRLTNIVKGQESGGRRFGSDGQILTSPKGAKGEMQVLDSTNKSPGFGVKPAADDSPDERARVGRDYLGAMLREFQGNVPQGLAAYNAGPGAVNEAIREANKNGRGSDWLAYLPKETQTYVSRTMGAYNAGGGAPARPTLADVHAQVRETLGPTASPERVRIATEATTKMFSEQTAATKQREDEAVTNAQTALIQNGGNFAALPNDVRAAIPPGKFDDMMSFAGKLSAGIAPTTNWDLYYSLKRDPEVLGRTNLGVFRDKLSDSDFKSLVNEQQDIRAGKTENVTRIQNGKQIMDGMMREVGIDPTPKDTDKANAAVVGRLLNGFQTKLESFERTTGKKASETEMKQIAGQVFQAVEIEKPWYWPNRSAVSGAVAPGERVVVPPDQVTLIDRALKARGIVPTDDLRQNLYRRQLSIAPLKNNG